MRGEGSIGERGIPKGEKGNAHCQKSILGGGELGGFYTELAFGRCLQEVIGKKTCPERGGSCALWNQKGKTQKRLIKIKTRGGKTPRFKKNVRKRICQLKKST